MRVLQSRVYKFDELSDTAKARARKEFRAVYVERDWWWDSVYDDAKTVLRLLGFDDVDISFTGFWSQGDGASFTGKWRAEDVKALELLAYAPEDKLLHALAEDLVGIAKEHGPELLAELKRISSRYAHEDTVVVECEDAPEIEERLRVAARHLMRWVYRQLRAEYEHITSNDSVDDSIRANDYEFYADGRAIRPGDYEEPPNT